MFKLHLEQADGSPLVVTWDPHKAALTNADGSPIDLAPIGMAHEPQAHRAVQRVHPRHNQVGKDRNLRMVRILFGLACNFSCGYCSQAVSRQSDDAIADTTDVDAFVRRLPEWCHTPPEGEIRFEFWGGEPLVYWKKIKRMAEAIRTMWPNAHFWMPTNGSLLDRDKVEWLMKLGFSLSISHDGPGQSVRGPDPLDDPMALAGIRHAVEHLAPMGRIAFNSVLTLTNHDPVAIRDFFLAKLNLPPGATAPQFVTEGMVMAHQAHDMLMSPLTEEDQRRVRRTIFDGIARSDMITVAHVSHKLGGFFNVLRTAKTSEAIGQRCSMDRLDNIALRLNGDVILCPNGAAPTQRLGSVYDFDNIRLQHSTHWSHRDECRHCPVLHLCSGGCMMFGEGSDSHRVTCGNAFTFEIAYLALALYMLTNARLVRIEGERIRFPGITAFDF
jgi:uncharacterized protein